MRSVFLLGVFIVIVCAGASTPFVFGMGYIWVDLFSPSKVSYSILTEIPIALVMAAGCIGTYLVMDRKSPPKFNIITFLLILFALWITFTTFRAALPGHAWIKWDFAFKAVTFSIFLPYLFRTRVQLEAMLLAIVVSLSGTFMTFGVKTLMTGGGYSMNLGLLSGNSGLAEGSTLAMVVACSIPFQIYLMRHSLIFPKHWIVKLGFLGFQACSLLTILGTHARTGLISLGVLAMVYWWLAANKIRNALIVLVAAAAALSVADDSWLDRMSTVTEYNTETSALGRIVVWKWTWDYVQDNPLGGGFGVYRLSRYTQTIINEDGEEELYEVAGKAFHSAYFEVLGEHGYLGLALYLLIILLAVLSLRKTKKKTRDVPELTWARDLSTAVMTAILVHMAGSSFIGVAFQPFIYYYVAIAISLDQYVRRVYEPQKAGRGSRKSQLKNSRKAV
ncbi:putative O-glycosylation ligase, exosortase A system-associated [Aestuariispira insulae]|uniref:Putative O-glycosylation ligase (Exosortase A-associated) n=1 Tax=Aestuariispira insulae TaxID=1461337 RepID=A0A3D9HK54_9PROT|nr:putative O-glycosylation ligase, exosortase A system-associated [Aestuariispira insulae]RED49879.1 putative O-glycosylation ligase (exosortase A-associated) [Aestuariispira insulae]